MRQRSTPQDSRALEREILGPLARRYGTATVLLHQAVARHLGLAPGDHKCLDVLLERGPMTARELAGITGLTSGALTGVVNRLESAGRIRREPNPHDGRSHRLSVREEGNTDIVELFAALDSDRSTILEGFDGDQLEAIAQFLVRATESSYQRLARLRTHHIGSATTRPDQSTSL